MELIHSLTELIIHGKDFLEQANELTNNVGFIILALNGITGNKEK
ncbi:hypothetical protein QP794_23510 [Paenibacillus sp. UMB7766-LJ446]|nr:hypothetical protein [Paenibacillus sp. UMB7766-LJ446]MDK8193061.1 hypothetical protein [Paenibacillus sp. UMB7766-LJ446]